MYGDNQRTSAWILTAAALACLACSSRDTKAGDADTTQGDTAAAAGETQGARSTPATGAAESNPADAPLTVADIERWERGQRAEMEAVEKAMAGLKQAKGGMDTASAILSATPGNTVEAGARAAGVSVDRYRRIDDMIGQVLSARMMGEAMQKNKAAMDTVNMTPEMRARVREGLAQTDSAWGDPFKNLAPDVAAVLKRRGAELDTLRWTLTGARLGKIGKTAPKP